jgi:two-component system cell cycle sensor histidine kinase/response regulator CckA
MDIANRPGMSDLPQRIRDLEEQLAREVTARQEIEHALHESEARFRSMARNLTDMVLAYDMNRRLMYVNPAVHTLTGYSAADLEKEQFICWVHTEDRERMLGYWDRLFDGHTFQEEEYRLVTRDGRIKWMAASWGPLLDESGRQVGVQGREREVTHRRMAEETLRIREERYRTLFEDSPFPMWEEDFSRVKQFLDQLQARGVTDIRAHLTAHRADAEECVRRIRVIDVNRAAREFYGATREQLMGDLTRIFDDAAYDVICEEMTVLAAQNPMYRTELETQTLRGEARSVTMIVSIEPSPGDWSRVIVSFFDITDHKRLEAQVLQSQKLESLGRLAGGIAHDFNNLLMIITGYSDLLLGDAALAQDVRSALGEIRNAGERGAELTQQLLAFSRKQVGQPRALNLNSLISESQGMLQRLIGEDIELVVRLEPEAWTIRADRGQIHQALMNLVVNAREAMPAGGMLTIETRNACEASGDFLRLCVWDTGVGMDDRTQQHVFEPFFTTKSLSKGTGLGLATVFGVVTQAGGHLSVHSEPGHGSQFSLYFPRLSAPPSADPGADVPRAPFRKEGTVLLVEDQAEVRHLTCTILRNMGFTVLEAMDAGEAIATAQGFDGEICMMLTDVIMPGMNGKELAQRMGQLRPQTKVVFMSGYTDRIMSRDGVLDESVEYLQKPFTADQLGDTVRRVLQ